MPAWIQRASRRKERTPAAVGLFAVSALLWSWRVLAAPAPDAVAVTPNDQYAYVTNASPGTVTVIGDADTGGTTATSHDPGQAYQAADEMTIAGTWPRGLMPPAEDDGVRLQAGV